MIKHSLTALTIFAALTGSAMAAVTQSQSTSVGVVGASVNNIGAVGLSSSGALGLATNINAITQTQTADPANINLNSLHQLDQQLQGQLQGQLQ